MRLCTILGAALALAWGQCASAAIGTPTSIGVAGTGSAVTSLSITSVNVTAGNAILVEVATAANSSAPTASDGTNGAYTCTAPASFVGSRKHWLCYFANSAAVAGGTISLGWTTSSSGSAATAFQVSGLATSSILDVTGTLVGGTATTGTMSITPGATASTNGELVFGVLLFSANSAGYAYNGGGSGTYAGALTSEVSSGGNTAIYPAYQIVNSTTAATYNPSWTTSTAYALMAWTFKGAAGAASGCGALALMGVGC